MHALKKFLVHSPGHYIASVILTAAVGVFRYFTLPEGVGSRFALYEILSVSGFVTFLIGALMTVSYVYVHRQREVSQSLPLMVT